MSTTEYTVTGMTCNGCATTVTNAVAQVDVVEKAEVDMAYGRLTVHGGTSGDQPGRDRGGEEGRIRRGLRIVTTRTGTPGVPVACAGSWADAQIQGGRHCRRT